MIKSITHCFVFLCILCLAACNPKVSPGDGYTLLVGWGSRPLTTLPFDSLTMSDPFILADEESKMYYLVGSGGSMWKSPDLDTWEGPFNYIEIDTASWMGKQPLVWAPELHKRGDLYYCIATFTNMQLVVDTVPGRYEVQRRSPHILVSEKPEGPYRPLSDTPYLPEKWSTLDGTLWVEEGKPYLVFCHDWMQTTDGMLKYVELSPDLSASVGEPVTMFKASDAPWPREMRSIGELTYGMPLDGYVIDGPFFFRTGTGRLGMLWSSWSDQRYAQGVAYAVTGKLSGPWQQVDTPLVTENSGHAMLFRTFDGKLLMSLHRQSLDVENPGPRRPLLLEVDLSGNELKILGKYR
ncbi:glycoside hydrolase family 43 protein [Parabacteroides sp. OttesenSCG-928-O15]|nr:glycoside hydrolase family 43 protein [Parabacteroides sp. OttesenSCG-928-O15]